MRLKYDEETMNRIIELVTQGKTNSEICREFDVEENYPSLCARCSRIRKELDIKTSEVKKVDKNNALSLLTKVCSVESKTDTPSASTSITHSNIGGMSFNGFVGEKNKSSDDTLSKSMSDLESALKSFNKDIKLKLLDGFTPKELTKMGTYSKTIGDFIAKLESVQLMMDNITEVRKG